MVCVYHWGCLESEYHVLAEQVDTAALLHSSLKVLLTGMCHTGFPSTDSRQSHRVHSAHEAKKPYPPERHRRLKEAECPVGAAGWVDDGLRFLCWCVRVVFTVASLCFPLCRSSRIRESQGERSAPDKLLLRQQPVHEPQRQRSVRLRWWVRLQLRIGARRAAQQKEAARGAQLDLAAPGSLNRLHFFCLFFLLTRPWQLLPVYTLSCPLIVVWELSWRLCDRGSVMCSNTSTVVFPSQPALQHSFRGPAAAPRRQAALQFWRILCFSNVIVNCGDDKV